MILVGDFNEKDIKNGNDKNAVEKAKSKTGLKYTETKFIKKRGEMFLRVWVCSAEEFTI